MIDSINITKPGPLINLDQSTYTNRATLVWNVIIERQMVLEDLSIFGLLSKIRSQHHLMVKVCMAEKNSKEIYNCYCFLCGF